MSTETHQRNKYRAQVINLGHTELQQVWVTVRDQRQQALARGEEVRARDLHLRLQAIDQELAARDRRRQRLEAGARAEIALREAALELVEKHGLSRAEVLEIIEGEL